MGEAGATGRSPVNDEALNQPTLLLVEDDRRLQWSVSRTLRAQGYRVIAANSAAEAVSILGSVAIDLMLLDVNLPDATGWDVLRQLDAGRNRPPTIVLSAMPPSSRRLAEFRSIDVLCKPFPIDALVRMIDLRIAGHALDQEAVTP